MPSADSFYRKGTEVVYTEDGTSHQLLRTSGSFPQSGSTPPRTSAGFRSPVDDDGSGRSDAPATHATLARELADFLVELSIAMQKHAIYPAGHPLLKSTVAGLFDKLLTLLIEREHLALGIARRQLIIEGVATDPNHPLLKELAGRLHRHALGAIRFEAGVTVEEVADVLATVAQDAGRMERPLGDQTDELAGRWEHVRLYPLNYDRLELLYEGKDTEGDERIDRRRQSARPAQLWIGMARAAMMLDSDADVDEETLSPLVVAEAIDKRQQDQAYDQVVVGYLLQIADELKKAGGTPEAIELQKRISEMVRTLSPRTLRALLTMGGDMAQRKQFLLNAAQGMTVDAVMDLVQAASTDGTQTISHSMMRLFSKLSKYAEQDPDPTRRANADAEVRDQLQKLISDWNLDDPNPTAYGKVLQKLSATRGALSRNVYIDVEPERILQMGFELGVSGPRFEHALDQLIAAWRIDAILDLIDRAPEQAFADSVWVQLDSRDVLYTALAAPRIDFAVVERLVRRKRLAAIDPLLDAAEAARDTRIRERLLDILIELGDDAASMVVRRLEGARPDFRRELFLLLGKLPNIPGDFDASRYLVHPDAAVRREAIRLLLKFVQTREQAIVAAVTDSDERSVYFGLQAAQEGGCPPAAADIIRRRMQGGELDSALTTLAIRVLAATDSGAGPVLQGTGRTSQMMRAITDDADPGATADASRKTLEWLMSRVAQRSRFRKKWQLQDKSPEMLAALGALAAYWGHDPDVQEILSLAQKANDPELRKAMGAQRVTGRFRAIAD